MKKEEVIRKVTAIVLDTMCGVNYTGEISGDTDVVVDIGADSLDLSEIAINIERDFGIEVSEKEIAAHPTINGITNTVISKLVK